MSLERELVFQLRNEGNTEKDVLEIVEYMADPNGKGRAVRTDSKRIKVALSQYDARKELEKRGEYKRKFKDKLRDLIEEKRREIEDTSPNLISLKVYERWIKLSISPYCNNCSSDKFMWNVFAKIKYVNGKGEIPFSQIKKNSLFRYCRKCGNIEEKE